MAHKQNDCYSSVEKLFDKYKDNEYMLNRIYNHVTAYLPNTLDNESKNHERRKNRNTYLTHEQQVFIQVFLSKNNYFYLPNNNFYYEYNGKDYYIVKEDEIIHKLLSTISKDRVLLQWKYKTKMNVIRQIKDRNLFTSIPETDTIQSVLNALYPAIFHNKTSAKYFLTIIGDVILKNNNGIIYLVSNKMKQFINELDGISVASIGNDNVSTKFITKYHETHAYENCRLIKINENYSNDYWREILKRIGLNLLCVAAHYSKRYNNADDFLSSSCDNDLIQYSYSIKNTTPNEMVNKFFSEYIQKTSDESSKIEWRNIHFLWKQFLSSRSLPGIMYSNSLKNICKGLCQYDEANDCFIGVTSKYLPIYKDFTKFWQNNIVTSQNDDFENELEIDEITTLFKGWNNSHSRNFLSEESVLKLLKHFFPSVEIVEDKYILNITCVLWNKAEEINSSLDYIKEQIKNNNGELGILSFDDAYNYYQKFCSQKSKKIIVSKRYFEKYLYYKLADHVVYEKFIDATWSQTFDNSIVN